MLDRVTLKLEESYAVLIGVILPKQKEQEIMECLQELEMLAQTAGVTSVRKFVQRVYRPHTKTFVGSGKLEEIAAYIKERPEIKMAIFDDDLSGAQFAAVEKILDVRIVDRSMLILDIFALHAKTARSKTQIEMAQYQYLLPRLRGMWKHLERQGGGIGTRGPGETELETDRRIVKQKITQLKTKLKKIEQQGSTQRKNRTGLIQIALSGYTNAGKTAIMNFLTKERLVSQDKLFVTLDTTTRKVHMPDCSFLLSDTVGFIQKTPHHLIASFRTTLEEVCTADILLHIIDVSHLHNKKHYKVVQDTLKDIGAADNIPTIIVLNKLDLLFDQGKQIILSEEDKQLIKKELLDEWQELTDNICFLVSAVEEINMEELRNYILLLVKEKQASLY